MRKEPAARFRPQIKRMATATVMILALPPGAGGQEARVLSGKRSTIILSLKTAEGPPSQCSNANLTAMYFTDQRSVSAYYAENSYGLVNISGIVTGPYIVNLGTDWSPRSVASAADSAAMAAGVDLSIFAQKIYILPKEADPIPIQSSWGGTTRGTRSQLWIRDYWCSSKWLAVHELGHNFGLSHASTPADEYGDFSSPMGARVDPASDPSMWNSVPHYNAPEKVAAGWLPTPAVHAVTAAGTFHVASVETRPAPGQIQVLRIKGANGGADEYWISYRQAVGFSSILTPQYVSMTSITRWSGAMGSKTCLLATLADGQAFVDTSGLMVAQSSHTETHAYITVTFGAASLSDVAVTCP